MESNHVPLIAQDGDKQQYNEQAYGQALADSDHEVRLGFIKKVYGILASQLTFTALFVYIVMETPSIQGMFKIVPLVIAVLVLYITSICALVCCGMHKKVPLNYILLFIFTACVSFIVAATCMRYNKILVLEAAIMTAAITVALTVYAYTTKTDFTICGSMMFTFGGVLISTIFLMVIFGYTNNLLFCMLGVFLFSFYLVCDTQMIIGGKNKRYQLNEDEYILGAVILYLDIINLFLEILQAMSN